MKRIRPAIQATALLFRLIASHQQEEERNREVEEDDRPHHPLPGAGRAGKIPDDVHRQIGNPNQHELEPGHVGPHDQQSQQRLARSLRTLGESTSASGGRLTRHAKTTSAKANAESSCPVANNGPHIVE